MYKIDLRASIRPLNKTPHLQFLKESTMFRHIFVLTALIASSTVLANASDEQTTISANEPVITLAASNNSWTVISMESNRGMSKVRKFFDMGASGVQQIDYVVNCSNKSVALAGFSILKSENVPAGPMASPSYDDLSFYTPKLDIDRNVANTACDKRLAMSNSNSTN
jgi:hypothetical protein